MKSRPILFSAPMVRAILAGTKTQTRRILRPQPDAVETHRFLSGPLAGKPYEIVRCLNPPARLKPCNSGWSADCPGQFLFPGTIGDELWVRETWRTSRSLDHCKPSALREGSAIAYEADGRTNINNHERGPLIDPGRIRQSIFMRRWMSRIHLTITGIRVQRLTEINREDAIAEGIENQGKHPVQPQWKDYSPDSKHRILQGWDDPIHSYRSLWESIHGPASWRQNLYVCAITFSVQS